MKYLLAIMAEDLPGSEELAVLQRECPAWIEEMDGRGVRLFGRELDVPETAATVRVRQGETVVTDGPFAEAKEFVAGFDLLECADLDEAIEVAAEHPCSWFQAIEVLPFLHEPRLAEPALAFGRGEDGERRPYLLAAWMAGGPAAPVDDQAVAAWRRDARARGVHVLGEPLQDAGAARTVRVRDGERLISTGPKTGNEAFIGGLDVISCSDRQEAIELASAHPWARAHAIEVRPFWSD